MKNKNLLLPITLFLSLMLLIIVITVCTDESTKYKFLSFILIDLALIASAATIVYIDICNRNNKEEVIAKKFAEKEESN